MKGLTVMVVDYERKKALIIFMQLCVLLFSIVVPLFGDALTRWV